MTTIAELREQVRGPVIEPGEDGYEEHRRVHNGMHDRRPALIVRAAATADVVAVLAGDLPFLTPELVGDLRARLTGDGVLVVDDTGRDQLLLGVWRTTTLRTALPEAAAHVPLRRVLAPLAVRRLRPPVPDGAPPPWTDCDTPGDLDRARAWAAALSAHRPAP